MRDVGLPFDGDRRPDAGRLAALDLGVVAGLILVGQHTHGMGPLANPIGAVEAIAPFAFGWVVAALLAGLYRRPDAGTPTSAVRTTAICWLAASNVGFLVRGSSYVAGEVPWQFTVVFVGVGLVAFTTVRGAYEFLVAP